MPDLRGWLNGRVDAGGFHFGGQRPCFEVVIHHRILRPGARRSDGPVLVGERFTRYVDGKRVEVTTNG